MLKILAILLFLFCAGCLPVVAKKNDKSNKHSSRHPLPNFIVLFMDDLGYGDLGFTGHPTTTTPNLDKLAHEGKILTTWYSGCNVCTGSRTALMTGRQFPRTGIPGVIGPTTNIGLPLNETTIAEHLRKAKYTTAMVGKWHLGQRQVYLPANRGFDYYLGIPYSDDMGIGIQSSCPAQNDNNNGNYYEQPATENGDIQDKDHGFEEEYQAGGFLQASTITTTTNDNLDLLLNDDPAGKHLPLVHQAPSNVTLVLEQPVDFTTLAEKYSTFATNFIEGSKDNPFFLYVPFSHVHATKSTPELQYAGCDFQGSTKRGSFGDALAESDWIVGNIMKKLEELELEDNTLILFTSDNGPPLIRQLSGGSEGLFTGRYSGYWNTGKGSTWEGGIRMPAFAYWKGTISPFSRSSEITSSLDLFPTLSSLAGLDLPTNRTYDGRDMSDILLKHNGKSKHDFLFFYGTCSGEPYWSISSVRHGPYKAHWCTAPGVGGSRANYTKRYDPPLLFNVEKDPSEANPISYNQMPSNPDDKAAMQRILRAYAMEKATFEFGKIIPHPDGPGEGPGTYGVCCDRSKDCYCSPKKEKEQVVEENNFGIFHIGTKKHHDKYHEVLGEEEPSPPRTRAQIMLQHNNNIPMKDPV